MVVRDRFRLGKRDFRLVQVQMWTGTSEGKLADLDNTGHISQSRVIILMESSSSSD